MIAPSLWGAHLGNADEPARAWLVVDQAEQMLYLATPEEAKRFLAEQWPRYTAPLEYTPEEPSRLLVEVEEAGLPQDWAEHLDEAVRESRANYRLMQQWLDQQGMEEEP